MRLQYRLVNAQIRSSLWRSKFGFCSIFCPYKPNQHETSFLDCRISSYWSQAYKHKPVATLSAVPFQNHCGIPQAPASAQVKVCWHVLLFHSITHYIQESIHNYIYCSSLWVIAGTNCYLISNSCNVKTLKIT